MRCDNCNGEVSENTEGLIVRQGGKIVTKICIKCVEGVKLAKITVTRYDTRGTFTYDQYQPIETDR